MNVLTLAASYKFGVKRVRGSEYVYLLVHDVLKIDFLATLHCPMKIKAFWTPCFLSLPAPFY